MTRLGQKTEVRTDSQSLSARRAGDDDGAQGVPLAADFHSTCVKEDRLSRCGEERSEHRRAGTSTGAQRSAEPRREAWARSLCNTCPNPYWKR